MSKSGKPSQKLNKSHRYLKYSGMVFQLFVLLLIAAWGGKKLDQHFGNETPYFTAGLLIFALIGYLVKLGVDLSREKDD